MTNEELCGTMMRVTDKIQERRVRFAGHNIMQVGTPLSKLGADTRMRQGAGPLLATSKY